LNPLVVTHHEIYSVISGFPSCLKFTNMGEIYGLKMKGQSNPPAKDRPLKPPRSRGEIIDEQQGAVNNQVTPQMRVKSNLASLQPGLADFFLFKFTLFLLNRNFKDLRIQSNIHCRVEQILVADGVFIFQLQSPPNNSVDFVVVVVS